MTYIASVIVNEGIVIAADSRAALVDFSNAQNQQIAFHDYSLKLHVSKKFNFCIAHTGRSDIENKNEMLHFSALISEFIEELENSWDKVEVNSLLYIFINEFIDRKYPNAKNQIANLMLIAAGYSGITPIMCFYAKKENPQFAYTSCVGEFLCSNPHDADPLPSMSIDDAIHWAKQQINIYVRKNPGKEYIIGGPIDYVAIKPAGIAEIQISQKHFFRTRDQFIRAYANGEFDIQLIPPFTKENLTRMFKINNT